MAKYEVNGVFETIRLGKTLGESITSPVVIELIGELGVGKTHFAKGVALGLEVTEELSSPTFPLVNLYEGGRLPLAHLDGYRLRSLEEAHMAGLEEVLQDNGVALVEWGDFLRPFYTHPVICVFLEGIPGKDDGRRIEIHEPKGV